MANKDYVIIIHGTERDFSEFHLRTLQALAQMLVENKLIKQAKEVVSLIKTQKEIDEIMLEINRN